MRRMSNEYDDSFRFHGPNRYIEALKRKYFGTRLGDETRLS